MRESLKRDRVALLIGVVAPVLLSLVLLPVRAHVANIHVALVLVLLVVAVASNGYRLAGVSAALAAVLCFDFFFTKPYAQFVIDRPVDVQTSVLLLVVGVGVTELAVWGRTQQSLASRQAGYLEGLQAGARVAATGGTADDLVTQISAQLDRALHLRRSYFQRGAAGLGDPPRLRRDGEIEWHHEVWDVARRGLPVDTDIELLVESGGLLRGRFMLSATQRSRVSLDERRFAVALADQLGSAMR